VRILFLLLLACAGCTAKKIERPSKEITFKNGKLLYRGGEFSGVVIERFPEVGTVRETHYRRGWAHGEQTEFTAEGHRVVARREFSYGHNSGVHEGWFPQGERRFHYEFDGEGKSHGDQWEWHASGHPSLFARFDHGRMIGKKMWREDGKIYMNWVFNTGGEAYGTPGTKLCFQLRN
jgi:antitoxin component YwqK of YwqJK toxin-antitoxin module